MGIITDKLVGELAVRISSSVLLFSLIFFVFSVIYDRYD